MAEIKPAYEIRLHFFNEHFTSQYYPIKVLKFIQNPRMLGGGGNDSLNPE